MNYIDRIWIKLKKWEQPGLPNHPWLHELANTPTFGRFVRGLRWPVEAFGGWKNRADFEEVGKFCLFVGHARSGSSLIASLVDAHPKIVVAHELDVFQSILDEVSSKQRLFYQLIARAQWFVERDADWTGYSYAVPSQHKGEYSSLKVIGDKRAGVATVRLRRNPELLRKLREIVEVPVYLIHIKRHPLDNISTLARNNFGDVEYTINRYFKDCDTIKNLRKKGDQYDGWLNVYHEVFIEETKSELKKIVNFLGCTTDTEYLNECSKIVYSNPSKSREKVDWTDSQIEKVRGQYKKYKSLNKYSV
jgi:hypothetical protein